MFYFDLNTKKIIYDLYKQLLSIFYVFKSLIKNNNLLYKDNSFIFVFIL